MDLQAHIVTVLVLDQAQQQAIREAHMILMRLKQAIDLEADGVLDGLEEIIEQIDSRDTHSRHVDHLRWAEEEVRKVTGSIPPSLKLVKEE